MIAHGTFREDLFYRLNVIHIIVPPLRERRDDIPVLVDYFLERFASEDQPAPTRVAPAAMKALMAYSWPGNVRELENVIERLAVTVENETIEWPDLPAEVRGPTSIALRPRQERRRTVADDLYRQLTQEQQSFWSTVYPLFKSREITRGTVHEIVRRALEESRGNYRIVARLFNMDDDRDYKRFMNFLDKHDCKVPFKDYR
jgi:DNA-binding NtrC family response regulator